MFGYGVYCEDCAFAKDGYGETVGEDNKDEDDVEFNGGDF